LSLVLRLVERRTDYRIIAAVTENSPNPIKVAYYLQQTSLVKLAEPDLDTFVDGYAPMPGLELEVPDQKI